MSLQGDSAYEAAQAKVDLFKFSGKSDTVITIPVVFHIIWKFPHQNLSEAQIYSQIEVLNEDYRRQNNNLNRVRSQFTAADVKLEFCLAKTDPNGAYTHGITRTQTNLEDIGVNNTYFNIQPAWDRDEYLNIWVGDFGNDIAGQAFPPGSPRDRDGVMIDYTNFGRTGTVVAPYHLGRTLSHEVGHWLGLLHPWGVNASCGNDDMIADTPNQSEVYFGCPITRSSCGSVDNTENFMGYVNDACMAHFSPGQKAKMRSTLLNQRTSITRSIKGCNALGIDQFSPSANVELYPNPSNGKVNLLLSENSSILPSIQIYDLSGRTVKYEFSENNGHYSLDLTDLSRGLYFIELLYPQKRILKKLVINN